MDSLIRTQNLTKRFERLTAVESVQLRVAEGEILALLGPNGAGKTTTIRMLASILRPTSGEAWIAGHSVLEAPVQVRRRVGLLTEHHGLYTRMVATDYLAFFGGLYGLEGADFDRRVLKLLGEYGLADALEQRLGEYSRGMRQKLALVRAMLHDPPVLLLDEPTSAMDPASARMVRESITQLRSSRRAIIVCTHNLSEAEALADRIAIIRHGQIIADDTPQALKNRLLGEPIMELRLAHDVNGASEALPAGASVLDMGKDWIRYRTSQPSLVNPAVLAAMASAGAQVVTLSEVARSLEEVYLEVVGMSESGQSNGG